MDGSRMEDPPFLNIKKNTNSPITSTYDCCIEMEDPVYGDTSDAHPQGRCSGGWSSHNVHERSFCHKSFGRTDENQRKSFYSAAKHCKSQDGSLTSVLNEEEQYVFARIKWQ
ncbi:unnamed protein product [Porites lobata]|uniref:C-type lectin domain-containing protein n=1 Tax=Porites lobata TaxID=104759 RepID=A0ABN8MPE6_9CNID|nr:unnamed protein product [Porites lobata]